MGTCNHAQVCIKRHLKMSFMLFNGKLSPFLAGIQISGQFIN